MTPSASRFSAAATAPVRHSVTGSRGAPQDARRIARGKAKMMRRTRASYVARISAETVSPGAEKTSGRDLWIFFSGAAAREDEEKQAQRADDEKGADRSMPTLETSRLAAGTNSGGADTAAPPDETDHPLGFCSGLIDSHCRCDLAGGRLERGAPALPASRDPRAGPWGKRPSELLGTRRTDGEHGRGARLLFSGVGRRPARGRKGDPRLLVRPAGDGLERGRGSPARQSADRLGASRPSRCRQVEALSLIHI